MSQHVIALDQGTTSSRAIIFDVNGKVVSLSQHPFAQIYPQPGWVEHDPMTILYTQLESLSEAFRTSGLSAADIAAVGITNQRETTIVWEKETGRPVYNAIVWQPPDGASVRGAARQWLGREDPRKDRPSDRRLFLRHQAALDPR